MMKAGMAGLSELDEVRLCRGATCALGSAAVNISEARFGPFYGVCEVTVHLERSHLSLGY